MCLVTLEFYGSNIGAVDIRSFLLKLPPNWYFEETCVCSPMHKISFKHSKGTGVIPCIINKWDMCDIPHREDDKIPVSNRPPLALNI